MSRRDAFSNLNKESFSEQKKDQINDLKLKKMNTPLDFIPTAQPRQKRNREWEKKHKAEVATYRGVSKEIVDMVQRFADVLLVPRDEIVRAFLEYSLEQYEKDNLKIYAFPKAQRMTLYPASGQQAKEVNQDLMKTSNWLTETYPISENRKTEVKANKNKGTKPDTPQWKMRVTFRLPSILKEEVRNIALEHSVPVGEIFCYFIMEGSKAYRDGNLALHPVPKITSKTLFQNREK